MADMFRRTLKRLSSSTSITQQTDLDENDDNSADDQEAEQLSHLHELKHRLTVYVEQVQTIPRFDTLQRLQVLVAIKQILVEAPDTKDTFRESGGYVCLVSLLSSLEGIYESTSAQDSWDHDGTELEEGKHTKQQVVETFKAIFSVLAESMSDHDLNREVFRDTVGFDAVENALRLSGILGKDGSPDHAFGILFGFAIEDASVYNVFAATRKQLSELKEQEETDQPSTPPNADAESPSPVERPKSPSDPQNALRINAPSINLSSPAAASPSPKSPRSPKIPPNPHRARDAVIDTKMAIFASKTDIIRNPLAITAILNLQSEVQWDRDLSYGIYRAIYVLSFSNRRNQVVMNEVGILYTLLKRLSPPTKSPIPIVITMEGHEPGHRRSSSAGSQLHRRTGSSASTNGWLDRSATPTPPAATPLQPPDDETSTALMLRPNERAIISLTCKRLIEMGVSTVEIRYMFERVAAERSDPPQTRCMMDMILSGIQQSRWPRYLQFDMSQHGYSSVELKSIGQRQFPPSNSGYTFFAWINVERYDPNMHLTIFGLNDASQRCFMMAYIERDSHRLILQTSLNYSVRFKHFVFRPQQWYHIAIVHQRPRYSSSSAAALFVDGRFIESIKCTYPSQPASGFPIQAFLGTPKEFSPRLGRGMVSLAWNMGPAYLIDDDLPEDLLHVYYQLGPRYCSNFQDSLGQFQTYQTSSLLNMRLDAMARDKTTSSNDASIQNSIMVNAIRGKNSLLMAEEKILFAFTANNILSAGDTQGISGSGLSESGRQALKMATSRGKVIVNAAVSKVERALIVPNGLGVLTGEPVVANPCGIDESMWKIGGCAVGLRLVELAENSKQLYDGVCVVIELIRYSWRNSEDMERIHGYEVLANLLKSKPNLITVQLQNLIFLFVGLNQSNPNESVVVNPLAYRFLILDFDVWKKTDLAVQTAHLHQFVTFTHSSRFHRFNAKRLLKMHVVKKMLFALRTNVYPKELMPEFMATLKILVQHSFTTEVIRNLATFLVSTLCKYEKTRKLPPVPLSPMKRAFSNSIQAPQREHVRRSSSPLATSRGLGPNDKEIVDNAKDLSPRQFASQSQSAQHAGLLVLEMLCDILCDNSNPHFVSKFAMTITNKWPLLFVTEDSPLYCVILAVRILVRLFYSQGPSYISKFRTSSEGFVIMQKLVPHHWNSTQLMSCLLAMAFGVDIAEMSLDASFDVFTLSKQLRKEDNPLKVVCPEAFLICLLCMKKCLSTMVAQADAAEDFARQHVRDDRDIKGTGPSNDFLRPQHTRRRSQSLGPQISSPSPANDLDAIDQGRELAISGSSQQINSNDKVRIAKIARFLQTLAQFFSDAFEGAPAELREFVSSQEVVDGYVDILYHVVCDLGQEMTAEEELNSRAFGLDFNADAAFEYQVSYGNTSSAQFLRLNSRRVPAVKAAPKVIPVPVWAQTQERSISQSPHGSQEEGNFIVVSKDRPLQASPPSSPVPSSSSSPELPITVSDVSNAPPNVSTDVDKPATPIVSTESQRGDSPVSPQRPPFRPRRMSEITNLKNSTADSLMEFVVMMCVDSITNPSTKSLIAFDNALRAAPPSRLEDQMTFATFLMRHVLSHLKSSLQFNLPILTTGRVLTNVTRFSQRTVDLIFQGWFTNGADVMMEFLSHTLEILQQFEAQGRLKGQDQSIFSLYRALDRLLLLRLSEVTRPDSRKNVKEIGLVLDRLVYMQKVVLAPANTDGEFLRCLSFQMYQLLMHQEPLVRSASLNFWKLMMLNKPVEMAIILNTRVKGIEYKELSDGFAKLMETDVNSFFSWVEDHRQALDSLFYEQIATIWEIAIVQENRNSRDLVKTLHAKRIAKLRKLSKESAAHNDFMAQYLAKTKNWSRTINDIEWNRLRKTLQDNADQQSHIRSLWIKIAAELYRERALWGPDEISNQRWRLDFTEGKYRMRKKLQVNRREKQFSYTPKQGSSDSRDASPDRRSSVKRGNLKISVEHANSASDNVPPSPLRAETLSPLPRDKDEDTNSIRSANSNDDGVEAESDYEMVEDPRGEADEDSQMEEDKNRKVLRSLEHGDIVMDVFNISRIVGLDACESLLLLGKHNIYIIDNYFQKKDGEIVDVWDAPKNERDQYLQMIASQGENADRAAGTLVVNLDNKHQSRRWAFGDIQEVLKRRYLFRDVALELFFADGRSYLLTLSHGERDNVYTKLMSRLSLSNGNESVQGVSGDIVNQSGQKALGGLTSQITSRLATAFSQSSIYKVTKRWERKEISNFQYLMLLNTMAGRTYNDLTQYPVFPWILADYTSNELDLSKPETFRDFSKPMGAQTPDRRKEFEDRYKQWLEMDDDVTKPFHYGTHYSSAMIVCSYLIRLEPFTQQYLKLQGGHFDHADRLFHSMGGAWMSASKENRGDVRELIPEFFYLPEFLVNSNAFDFGMKQGSGEAIDSVVLPPWAKGDPAIFISKHREALESEYVSAHLHEWIDLIFGHKQQGPEAVGAVNVFHHLSYEGAIDLDKIEDPVQRSASIGIIHNFGQTPRQLFNRPHSARLSTTSDPSNGVGLFRFEENVNLLIESIAPIIDIGEQVYTMYTPREGEKATCAPSQQLLIPPTHQYCVAWGFADGSLRAYQTDTKKLIGLFESMHLECISCACFTDSRTFVTGGTDAVVCIWKLTYGKTIDFKFTECLRGHSKSVTAIAASRTFSIIVSGSEDNSCIVWDLNRATYVRQLRGHDGPVQLVAINNVTGDIATCSGGTVRLWTINGDLLVQRPTSQMSDPICSVRFYEGIAGQWQTRDLLFTGHKKGIIQIWSKVVSTDEEGRARWALAPEYRLQDELNVKGANAADITAIHFNARTMYTGDSDGRVRIWCLPDDEGEENRMADGATAACLSCGVQFGVLERRTYCKSCGGIFCSQRCTLVHPVLNTRTCKPCATKLARHGFVVSP